MRLPLFALFALMLLAGCATPTGTLDAAATDATVASPPHPPLDL